MILLTRSCCLERRNLFDSGRDIARSRSAHDDQQIGTASPPDIFFATLLSIASDRDFILDFLFLSTVTIQP